MSHTKAFFDFFISEVKNAIQLRIVPISPRGVKSVMIVKIIPVLWQKLPTSVSQNARNSNVKTIEIMQQMQYMICNMTDALNSFFIYEPPLYCLLSE